MSKEKIFILGSGGHAKVVIDTIHVENNFIIGGVIDFYNNASSLLNYPLFNKQDDLLRVLQKNSQVSFFVAIGENAIREKEVNYIKSIAINPQFPSIIHRSAIISKSVIIRDGVFIGPGSIVNAGCEIGFFSIINTGASVDHDSKIGNFSSIGPGVTTGGGIHIGDFTHIGLGANLLEKTHIGNCTLIGAASLIAKDVGDYSVVYGIPGEFIRCREKNDKIFQ